MAPADSAHFGEEVEIVLHDGDDSRPIPEPYVCIAVQASSGAKMWNNPLGWHDITRLLREAGYRVSATWAEFADWLRLGQR